MPWRGRGYQTSRDYLRFEGQASFLAGTPPGSDELVYAFEPFYYESLYLGIWARYRHEPDGLLDPQLAASRNGLHWERPTKASLIKLTPLPAGFERKKTSGSPETGIDPFATGVPWDYGNSNINSLGPIRVRDELWFYYSGRTSDHRSSPQTGAIGLAKLRLDGFASLDAASSGTLITRPVLLSGGPLHVNADARGGELRVEILDETLQPIAPLTAANCDAVDSDNVRHEISWNGSSGLSSVRGRKVRLRVTMQRSRLFALWVGPERNWNTSDTSTWRLAHP